ncbi:13940_t:CDS:2, partial [Gigaspora rosea]
EICLDNNMKGEIKGYKGSKKMLSKNDENKASASKNKLQDLLKNCDKLPEIAQVMSKIMISTIRPLGKLGARGYIKETSIR